MAKSHSHVLLFFSCMKVALENLFAQILPGQRWIHLLQVTEFCFGSLITQHIATFS